jgi:3-dehydroquinate synthase
MTTLRVEASGKTSIIHIARGALARTGALARAAGLEPGPCAIVTDTRVRKLYGAALARSLRKAGFEPRAVIAVPPGETSKSLARAASRYRAFAAAGLERGRPVFALGGGVVGDLAGFAAATWLRGVPLVMVPTSLLAQVDSSVGGKVGVDLAEGKNLVGAFHQPRVVVIDPDVLATLPPRHVRAGLAEAAKVGWTLDASLARLMERRADALKRGEVAALAPVILRAVRAKANVVSRDERDEGARQILNYGHTAGHALEALGGYRRWIHGEAVALGMAIACALAVRRGVLSAREASRQLGLLTALGFPAPERALAGVSARKVFQAMQLDKKRSGGNLRFVLTAGMGVASFGTLIGRAEVIAALQDAGCRP